VRGTWESSRASRANTRAARLTFAGHMGHHARLYNPGDRVGSRRCLWRVKAPCVVSYLTLPLLVLDGGGLVEQGKAAPESLHLGAHGGGVGGVGGQGEVAAQVLQGGGKVAAGQVDDRVVARLGRVGGLQ